LCAEFFYQTMDAIDGKQARRTNTSSPLGQLFDHGCDAIVAAVLIHHLCSAVGLAGTLYHPLILVLGLSVFYLAQYEETVTGTLRTNVGQIGVTEAQVLAISVHLLVAASGTGIFLRSLASFMPTLSFIPTTLTLGEGIGAMMLAIILFAAVFVIFNAVITTKQSIRRTLLPVLPTFLLGAATIAIFLRAAFLPAFKSGGARPSSLGKEVPGVVLLIYAISQIHLSTKTIVFGMAKQKFEPFQLMSLTVPLLFVMEIMDSGLAQASSVLVLLMTGLGYASLVSSFVLQISHALGIKVFKVRPIAPEEMVPHAGEAPTTVPEAGTFVKPETVRDVEVIDEASGDKLRLRVKSGLMKEDREEDEGSEQDRSSSGKDKKPGGSSTVPTSSGSRRRRIQAQPASAATSAASTSSSERSPSAVGSPSSAGGTRRRQASAGSRARKSQ
jgi:phosphatidylglycerophosphate synthase